MSVFQISYTAKVKSARHSFVARYRTLLGKKGAIRCKKKSDEHSSLSAVYI